MADPSMIVRHLRWNPGKPSWGRLNCNTCSFGLLRMRKRRERLGWCRWVHRSFDSICLAQIESNMWPGIEKFGGIFRACERTRVMVYDCTTHIRLIIYQLRYFAQSHTSIWFAGVRALSIGELACFVDVTYRLRYIIRESKSLHE